ncbi:uncharacterized protein TNCT_407471 [Trichonephila clavata]|uniref:Uncharacterized protein n=1 Tax=Trichonephila clavata TaxID=2740835 RepID=A0A8X6F2P6_TRICU|nr:uncharacterized protein TNCT_407471 [Trichonephila clavata]
MLYNECSSVYFDRNKDTFIEQSAKDLDDTNLEVYFERLTEQVDAIPVKKEFSTGNVSVYVFRRKSKILSFFTFYSCELCGDYCSFSSKGFRSHRVTVHKIGVLKERTWDRFGHPFEPLETETPPAPEINPNDLDEQRQLEWALKDSALMYAAK